LNILKKLDDLEGGVVNKKDQTPEFELKRTQTRVVGVWCTPTPLTDLGSVPTVQSYS
jgi:hypothetical protein